MVMPRARTLDEAHLYMDLTACPCGETDFEREEEILSYDPPVVGFTGFCSGCGRPRRFTFLLADVPDAEADQPAWATGDDPSTIVDAGQWLVVAHGLAAAADQARVAGPLDHERVAVVYGLLHSTAAAVDEVLKFLPPGADAVPDGAFWTEAGRAMRMRGPEWFTRDALRAVQAERWQEATDFADEHEVDAG